MISLNVQERVSRLALETLNYKLFAVGDKPIEIYLKILKIIINRLPLAELEEKKDLVALFLHNDAEIACLLNRVSNFINLNNLLK